MLAAVALCTLAVPTAAHAYCRTTTQPLPANYSPSRGCFTQGLYLFWRNACVSYSINHAASRNIPYDDAKRVIDESFATWMRATCADGSAPGIAVSNIGPANCGEVRYNADSPNQNVIVFRDDVWPYDDPYSTLGLTTVTFNAETGEIYDADMEINSSARNLSITDQVPAKGFDLESVITHEVGHFLGLAHATDVRSTMYASYKPGSSALRTLAPDDVAGLCAIYPNEVDARRERAGQLDRDDRRGDVRSQPTTRLLRRVLDPEAGGQVCCHAQADGVMGGLRQRRARDRGRLRRAASPGPNALTSLDHG